MLIGPHLTRLRTNGGNKQSNWFRKFTNPTRIRGKLKSFYTIKYLVLLNKTYPSGIKTILIFKKKLQNLA